MIRVKLKDGQQRGPEALGGDGVGASGAGASGAGVLWVDAQDVTDAEIAHLRQHLRLHPLALEDALEHGHWSRAEEYPEHQFITFRTLVRPRDDERFTERLSFFLYPDLLLTLSRSGTSYLDKVWGQVGRESVNTAPEIVFELLDEGAQTFFRYIAAFEDALDEMEERIYDEGAKPRSGQAQVQASQEVFGRKHRLAQVRTLNAEALTAVTALNRHVQVNQADLIRLRDVQDSLSRAGNRLDGLRDSLRGLLDLQLSLQNQRMNEVMKTLTAVSTVFLPLTFLAGVWGMNFQFIPELHWKYGYAFSWAMFALIAVILIVYFRRRRWW